MREVWLTAPDGREVPWFIWSAVTGLISRAQAGWEICRVLVRACSGNGYPCRQEAWSTRVSVQKAVLSGGPQETHLGEVMSEQRESGCQDGQQAWGPSVCTERAEQGL